MHTLVKVSLTIASSIALSGCMSSKMSPQQENALGAQQEQQYLSKAKTVKSGTQYNSVKRVGQRIAKASGRPDFKWTYHLVKNDKQANAFVLPGGKIFVYTGLFKYAKTDDQLAAVMGHEVAHALESHGVRGASKKQTAGLLGAALQIGLGVAGVDTTTISQATKIYGYTADLGYIKPYSRNNESEADAIGLNLMAKAGYNPNAALTFWNAFSASGNRTPEYLSTHPAPQTRIADIKKRMPEAMAIYNKSKYNH